MNNQQEFHGYNANGVYMGVFVATPEQFAGIGHVAGKEPVPIKAEVVRSERNALLEANVDPIGRNYFAYLDMTPAEQAELRKYRRDLLDVPQQAGFPETIAWPAKPIRGK